MMYWATAMLLWLVITQMRHALGVHLPSKFSVIDTSLNLRMLSHNICQSVPYFLQNSTGTLGPSLLAIPLVAVIEILKDIPGYELEVMWTKLAMQRVRGSGITLMQAGSDEDSG